MWWKSGLLVIGVVLFWPNSTVKRIPSSRDLAYPRDFYPNPQVAGLLQGDTHYYLFGPNPASPSVSGEDVSGGGDKTPIVLVHGLQTPSVIWHQILPHLTKNNNQPILAYDLYGRGFSDAPMVPNDEALFTHQLLHLLRQVGWKRVNLLCLSMGGVICMSFSKWFPEMVEKVALLAPAGLIQKDEVGSLVRLVQMPVIGEILALSLKQAFYWFPNWVSALTRDEVISTEAEALAESSILEELTNHPGSFHALISSLRHYPLTDSEEAIYAAVTNIPVLLLMGDGDLTINPKVTMERFARSIPQAQVHVIKGGGHGFVLTHAIETAEKIIDFFK